MYTYTGWASYNRPPSLLVAAAGVGASILLSSCSHWWPVTGWTFRTCDFLIQLTASFSRSMMVSSSSKCLSLISSFFICVSTSRATRDFIFLSSTAARCWWDIETWVSTGNKYWLVSNTGILSCTSEILSPELVSVTLTLSKTFFTETQRTLSKLEQVIYTWRWHKDVFSSNEVNWIEVCHVMCSWCLTLALVAADARAAAAAVAMFPSPMSSSNFFLLSSPSSVDPFSSLSFSCSEGEVSIVSSLSLSEGGEDKSPHVITFQKENTE